MHTQKHVEKKKSNGHHLIKRAIERITKRKEEAKIVEINPNLPPYLQGLKENTDQSREAVKAHCQQVGISGELFEQLQVRNPGNISFLAWLL